MVSQVTAEPRPDFLHWSLDSGLQLHFRYTLLTALFVLDKSLSLKHRNDNKKNKKQTTEALPGLRMNFRSFQENCLIVSTSRLSAKGKQGGRNGDCSDSSVGNPARTSDNILLDCVCLCLGYSMRGAASFQGIAASVGTDFQPLPRRVSARSAIGQPPVVCTVTFLRAEGSICLLLKKQHLFMFILQGVYLQAQTRLKALFHQGKSLSFAQKNALSGCLRGFCGAGRKGNL